MKKKLVRPSSLMRATSEKPSRPTPRTVSDREAAMIRRRLRYLDPANVLADFPSRRERAAIAAVFEWLGLNSTVAWRNKNGTYTNYVSAREFGSIARSLDKTEAIVVDEATYDRARAMFGLLGPAVRADQKQRRRS